jgi:hypothetical protein
MEPDITDPNIRWHYDNGGFGYDPKTETAEQGRLRCATARARAEAWLKSLPKGAVKIEWDADGPWEPLDDECPAPDLVYQLVVKVTLPPRTLLREVSMGWDVRCIYKGPAPDDGDEDEASHIATFFDADRAADYVRQANAPRVFTYSLGMIGMMHATERDDSRMFEAEAALELLAEWEET